MNGDELPAGHGGPLRLRLPRQVGYKNMKFLTHLTVTGNLKTFGQGLGARMQKEAMPGTPASDRRRRKTWQKRGGIGLQEPLTRSCQSGEESSPARGCKIR
jgi:DMSO/TMAO reductase YedYZ molybdopterin-dependent catalytic subunit